MVNRISLVRWYDCIPIKSISMRAERPCWEQVADLAVFVVVEVREKLGAGGNLYTQTNRAGRTFRAYSLFTLGHISLVWRRHLVDSAYDTTSLKMLYH